MNTSVVLIGPMGAGKSAVGSALAAKLQVPWVDTDERIQARAGTSISDIFVRDGEAVFRELEREEVALALRGARREQLVVSLGGGAILDAGTFALLQEHPAFTVFLDVTWRTVADRIGLHTARPLLLRSPRATWLELMEHRRGLYEDLADFTIATDDLRPDELVAAIGAAREHHA